jgi:hypothetical protein
MFGEKACLELFSIFLTNTFCPLGEKNLNHLGSMLFQTRSKMGFEKKTRRKLFFGGATTSCGFLFLKSFGLSGFGENLFQNGSGTKIVF